MRKLLKKLPALASIALGAALSVGTAQAQDKTITLCWAAWDRSCNAMAAGRYLRQRDPNHSS